MPRSMLRKFAGLLLLCMFMYASNMDYEDEVRKGEAYCNRVAFHGLTDEKCRG